MLYQIQQRLNALLSPYKDATGRVSPQKCSDQDLARLEKEILKLFQEGFDWYEAQGHSRNNLYRKWVPLIHPDKGRITENFILDGNLVVDANTMADIDKLFSKSNAPHIANHGQFFNLIVRAKEKPSEDKQDEKFNLNNFAEQMEKVLLDQQLLVPNALGNQMVLKNLSERVFIRVNDNQYFVGEAREWLQYTLKSKIHETLSSEENIRTASHRLLNSVRDSFFRSALFFQPNPGNPVRKNYFDDALLETYRDGELHKPVEPTLLSAGEAMIKYHLAIANEELLKRPVQNALGRSEIFPRGFINEHGLPFSYRSGNISAYHRYEMYLSLWNALYADPTHLPNLTKHRSKISKYAAQEYTRQQYDTLNAVFSNNPDPALLNRLGLTPEIIRNMNAQLFVRSQTPTNWLKEETNWLYSHGTHAPICRPWAKMTEGGIIVPEDYWEAYFDKQFDKIGDEIGRHPQYLKLNRFPRFIGNVIIAIPVIFFFASFFSLMLLEAEFGIAPGLIQNFFMGSGLFMLLGGFSVAGYGFCESFLDNLARLHTPLNIPHPTNRQAKWQHEFNCQIVLPLKRILFNPVDEYYTGKTRTLLQLMYPLRALLGIVLATAAAITFVCDGITQNVGKALLISYFTTCNIWFDYPEYIASFKNKARQAWETFGAFFRHRDAAGPVPAPVGVPAPAQQEPQHGPAGQAFVPMHQQRNAAAAPLRDEARGAGAAPAQTEDAPEQRRRPGVEMVD